MKAHSCLARWVSATFREGNTVLFLVAAAFFPMEMQGQYVPPTNGLVSWWRGDGNANDSADGNNGTAFNGAGYASGVFGSAFSFDGFNDHVRIPNSSNLSLTNGITLGAWVYPRIAGSYHDIISKWDSTPIIINQRSYALNLI
jgi:hypothetical protein